MLWKKNGKLIKQNGKLADCPTCPCTTPVPVECSQAVDDAIQAYLDLLDPDTQQHLWTLYGTYEASYQCAEWAYDDSDSDGEGTWHLVHPASGYLLVALEKGEIVTDTTNGYHRLLTYAKTIYNIATGEYKTIGCQCRVLNYECTHRKVSLSDFLIAGELRVWWEGEDASDSDSEAPEYLPEYSCQVNPCDLLKLKLETAQYWHGGTLMGEGYFDKWKYPNHSWVVGDYDYTPFQMAILWGVDSSDSESESESESTPTSRILTYIDCPCEGIYTEVMADDVTCLEYDGICTAQDPCLAMMLLHNECEVKGWIWHGEGVLAHRARVTFGGVNIFKDWYAWIQTPYWFGTYDEESAIRIFKACAETPEKFIFIDCYCNRHDTYYADDIRERMDLCYKRFDGTKPVSETNPADYRIYLDMDGVCNCSSGFSCGRDGDCGLSPFRELLLTYPDVFGLLEVCYGNHAKFDWSSNPETKTEYNYETQQYETHVEQKYGCGIFGDDNPDTLEHTLKIDYRAMCVIARGVWQDGTEMKMLRAIYPQGSLAKENHQNTDHYVIPASEAWSAPYGFYDNATIRGDYVIPFANDPDIGTVQLRDGVVIDDSRGGWNFTGETYAWKQGGGGGPDSVQINGCQPTESCSYESEQDAEDAAHCGSYTPTVCINVDDSSRSNWDKSALLSPDFTVVDHPCSIRRVDTDNTWTNPDGEIEHEYETHWCVIPRWITYGANVGECAWYLLNVNYIKTNKGLIVKGLDGFRESYTLIGVSNYPQYACGRGEGSEHWNDKVEECPADEEMHSCLGWTDWGDESDSSSDSNSSSESVSDSESTSVSEGV